MSKTYGVLCFALGPIYEDCAYLLYQSCKRLGLPITIVVSRLSTRLNFIQPLRLSKDFKNPFEAECLAYELSPYDVTLKVDADCLMLSLPCLVDLPMYSGNPRTISYQEPKHSPYREQERLYNLPEIYSTALVFSKSELCSNFFRLSKELFKTWYSLKFSQATKLLPTTDTIFSLAWALLQIPNPRVFNFVHAKLGVSLDQDLKKSFLLVSSGELFIQGLRQSGLFHYQDKEFLNHKVIESLGYVRLS